MLKLANTACYIFTSKINTQYFMPNIYSIEAQLLLAKLVYATYNWNIYQGINGKQYIQAFITLGQNNGRQKSILFTPSQSNEQQLKVREYLEHHPAYKSHRIQRKQGKLLHSIEYEKDDAGNTDCIEHEQIIDCCIQVILALNDHRL